MQQSNFPTYEDIHNALVGNTFEALCEEHPHVKTLDVPRFKEQWIRYERYCRKYEKLQSMIRRQRNSHDN